MKHLGIILLFALSALACAEDAPALDSSRAAMTATEDRERIWTAPLCADLGPLEADATWCLVPVADTVGLWALEQDGEVVCVASEEELPDLAGSGGNLPGSAFWGPLSWTALAGGWLTAGGRADGTPLPGDGTPLPGDGTPLPGDGTPLPGDGTPLPGDGTPLPGASGGMTSGGNSPPTGSSGNPASP